MKTKLCSEQPPTPGKSRKRKKVLSTESDEDNQADVYIECRRSVVDVRQMLNQWKYFRHNENFTDLHVYCGKESFVAISLHRAVLASCSPFLTRLLADRDETFLLLPDIDKDDFMSLVHLVYCESGLENQDTFAAPSEGLLGLLGIKVLAGTSGENQFRKDWVPDEVVPEIDDTALTTTAANNSVLVQTNFAGKTKKKKSSTAPTTEETATATATTTATTTTPSTTTPRLMESESALGPAKEGEQPVISKTVPANLQKGPKPKIYETVKSVKSISDEEKKKKSIYDIGSTSESSNSDSDSDAEIPPAVVRMTMRAVSKGKRKDNIVTRLRDYSHAHTDVDGDVDDDDDEGPPSRRKTRNKRVGIPPTPSGNNGYHDDMLFSPMVVDAVKVKESKSVAKPSTSDNRRDLSSQSKGDASDKSSKVNGLLKNGDLRRKSIDQNLPIVNKTVKNGKTVVDAKASEQKSEKPGSQKSRKELDKIMKERALKVLPALFSSPDIRYSTKPGSRDNKPKEQRTDKPSEDQSKRKDSKVIETKDKQKIIEEVRIKPTVTSNRPELNLNQQQVNSNKPEVNSNKPKVNSNKPEVNSNKPEVNSNKPEINSKKTEVTSTRPEVISTSQEIITTRTEVISTRPEVTSSTRPENISTRPEADSSRPELTLENSKMNSSSKVRSKLDCLRHQWKKPEPEKPVSLGIQATPMSKNGFSCTDSDDEAGLVPPRPPPSPEVVVRKRGRPRLKDKVKSSQSKAVTPSTSMTAPTTPTPARRRASTMSRTSSVESSEKPGPVNTDRNPDATTRSTAVDIRGHSTRTTAEVKPSSRSRMTKASKTASSKEDSKSESESSSENEKSPLRKKLKRKAHEKALAKNYVCSDDDDDDSDFDVRKVLRRKTKAKDERSLRREKKRKLNSSSSCSENGVENNNKEEKEQKDISKKTEKTKSQSTKDGNKSNKKIAESIKTNSQESESRKLNKKISKTTETKKVNKNSSEIENRPQNKLPSSEVREKTRHSLSSSSSAASSPRTSPIRTPIIASISLKSIEKRSGMTPSSSTKHRRLSTLSSSSSSSTSSSSSSSSSSSATSASHSSSESEPEMEKEKPEEVEKTVNIPEKVEVEKPRKKETEKVESPKATKIVLSSSNANEEDDDKTNHSDNDGSRCAENKDDAEVNVVDDDAEVNVGYDDADDSDTDSLRLVLTDSAVSSVSQKKSSFEDDEDEEMSTTVPPPITPPPTSITTNATTISPMTTEKVPVPVIRPAPNPPEKIARDTVEVFSHSTLPPPLPPRDNFLNTPMYYSASNDNFLQTPVHPFHFTEDEIEQELRSRLKAPQAAPSTTTMKETHKTQSGPSFTQEKLLTDVAKNKTLTLFENPPTPLNTIPWVETAEHSVDLSRTPRVGSSGSSSSSPSTQVSPASVHAQMLTDPSRTPQATTVRPSSQKNTNVITTNDSVNVNGFEELNAAAKGRTLDATKAIVVAGADVVVAHESDLSDSDSDDDDDDDDTSTVTSWSDGDSEKAWSEDDQMDDGEEDEEEPQHWRKRLVQKDDPSRNNGEMVNGVVLPPTLEEEETSDNERQQVLRDLYQLDMQNEDASQFCDKKRRKRTNSTKSRQSLVLLE